MKVLITGGAGFLGSNLLEHYLNNKIEVLVIDNLATGNKNNLTINPKLSFIEGSIEDQKLVDDIFSSFKPTHIIHSAASYKDPDNWQEDILTNVYGTINLVKASQKLNIKRFIYFQTALCYGKPKERPITLNHPLAPFTSYSISKTTGENYIVLSGLPYISLRLANIYGPRHYSGPMPAFYKRLKSGQKCTIVDTRRDFMDIEDFNSLIEKVIEMDYVTGCFNVSSGKDNSIKEVFDLMVNKMNINLAEPAEVIHSNEDDVASLLLDPTETEKVFNWKTKISLNEGLDNLIKWYDKNGVEQTFTHLKIGK